MILLTLEFIKQYLIEIKGKDSFKGCLFYVWLLDFIRYMKLGHPFDEENIMWNTLWSQITL